MVLSMAEQNNVQKQTAAERSKRTHSWQEAACWQDVTPGFCVRAITYSTGIYLILLLVLCEHCECRGGGGGVVRVKENKKWSSDLSLFCPNTKSHYSTNFRRSTKLQQETKHWKKLVDKIKSAKKYFFHENCWDTTHSILGNLYSQFHTERVSRLWWFYFTDIQVKRV